MAGPSSRHTRPGLGSEVPPGPGTIRPATKVPVAIDRPGEEGIQKHMGSITICFIIYDW